MFELIAVGIGATFLLIVLLNSFVIVGGKEIALLERKYFGKDMPQGRIVAQPGEVGIQAKILGPGFHFLIPFIFATSKKNFIEIKSDQVGLVESIDGEPVPSGKIFAKVVPAHDSFQDGEAFLLNGGQKGPQIQTLAPGIYRINPYLFSVKIINSIVIPMGNLGVVTAQDGEVISPGRLLAQSVPNHNAFQSGEAFLANGGQKGPQTDIILPGTYRINTNLFKVQAAAASIVQSGQVAVVNALDGAPLPDNEYVAKTVMGHNNYQDSQAFLKVGGQRGPQLDVLRPGTYYINPLLFNLTVSPAIEIQRGQVAVIVSNVGDEPTTEMKTRLSQQAGGVDTSAQEIYVVPKGYRGIQEEVVGPGRYYLNNTAFIPYIIDTTNQTIDWDDGEKTPFDPLKVVSKDGFTISVSVKVVVRVRPEQAPYMVAKVGSIENLISHVIHPMIDSSFRNQASTTSAMNFMQERAEEQQKAEERTRIELEKYHVECVSVLICQIVLPQDLMDTQTRQIIAQQQVLQFTEQQKAEESRINMEKTKSTATQQDKLVSAEIAVKVAEQRKQETVTLAEGESESVRLKGAGEAAAIEAKGVATAEAYIKQKEAIGPNQITLIEVLKHISEGKIKIMPDILTTGSTGGEGGIQGILTKLLAANLATDAVK